MKDICSHLLRITFSGFWIKKLATVVFNVVHSTAFLSVWDGHVYFYEESSKELQRQGFLCTLPYDWFIDHVVNDAFSVA
jgi:hypothetical protein